VRRAKETSNTFSFFFVQERKKKKEKKNGRRRRRDLFQKALSLSLPSPMTPRRRKKKNECNAKSAILPFRRRFFCVSSRTRTRRRRRRRPGRIAETRAFKKPRHLSKKKKTKMKTKNAPHRLSVRPLTSASPRARCTRTEPSRRRRRREISS